MESISVKTLAEQIAHRLGKLDDYVLKQDVAYSILALRSLFLRRQIERHGKPLQESYTRMKGVDLELVDRAEICDGSITIDCNVLRSVQEIPKPIQPQGSSPFSYVGSIGWGRHFDFITISDIPHISMSRFAGNRIKYAYVDNRLYIFNNVTLEKIAVMGIFEDPSQVIELCDQASGNCEGKVFYLEGHLIPLIKTELYKEYGIQQVEEFPKQEEVEVDE